MTDDFVSGSYGPEFFNWVERIICQKYWPSPEVREIFKDALKTWVVNGRKLFFNRYIFLSWSDNDSATTVLAVLMLWKAFAFRNQTVLFCHKKDDAHFQLAQEIISSSPTLKMMVDAGHHSVRLFNYKHIISNVNACFLNSIEDKLLFNKSECCLRNVKNAILVATVTKESAEFLKEYPYTFVSIIK